jgi:DNA-nicking Smr family endonuclease
MTRRRDNGLGKDQGLAALSALRDDLQRAAREREQQQRAEAQRRLLETKRASEFRDAVEQMGGVAPLAPHGRHPAKHVEPAPHARQRERDDESALIESVSDEIDVDSLLDTDDQLSYRRDGIGADVVRRLRRGEWKIQAEVDLHGHRVDEARESLSLFLKDSIKRGLRCVRVVHGKGLGSKDRRPVLRDKVRGWLRQREEVIAFCQARGPEGGGGAVIALLRPTTSPGSRP